MAEYLIQDTTLTDIANAIREKTGSTGVLTPSGMVTEIRKLGDEGTSEALSVQDTKHVYDVNLNSGLTGITPDEGYDAMKEIWLYAPGDLLPENILAGKTIFGVEGELEVEGSSGGAEVPLINVGLNVSITGIAAVGTHYNESDGFFSDPNATAYGAPVIANTAITILSVDEPITGFSTENGNENVIYQAENILIVSFSGDDTITIF